MSEAGKHILLDKAHIFDEKRESMDPKGYRYDLKIGAWVKKGAEGLGILVRSDEPNRPMMGTKKADLETGEDQKGE